MSRGRKLTVAGLAAIALTVSTLGQHAASAQESRGTSLSERISALGSAFKRKVSKPKPAASRPSTRNSESNANGHSQGGRSRAYSPTRRSLSSLLPKSLFGKKSQPYDEPPPVPGLDTEMPDLPPFIAEAAEQKAGGDSARSAAQVEQPEKSQVAQDTTGRAEAKVAPKAVLAARSGSAITAKVAKSAARKSPSTSRDENLQATLADLLENEATIADDAEPKPGPSAVAKQPVAIPPVADELHAPETPAEEIAAEDPLIEDAIAAAEATTESAGGAGSEEPGTDEDLTAQADAVAAEAETLGVAEKETVDDGTVAVVEDRPPAEEVAVVQVPIANQEDQQKATKQPAPFDISEAIVSIADEIAAEDAATSARREDDSDTTVAEAPAASSRLDLHETLTSGELADELAEAEAEAALVNEDSYAPAANARLAQLPLNPRAEERVAQVTALPFETMGEVEENEAMERPHPAVTASEVPAPAIRTSPSDIESEFQREVATAPNRIRTEARPITSLRKPHSDVLMTSEQPVIVSHVEGPRSILVGREASYRVVLENTSAITAHNLSAAIQVPDWADLVDVTTTSGEVEEHTTDADARALQWQLPELAARSSQTLRLRLIPRTGREFQLGVQWSQESNTAEARVEVREPKLEMSIQGPQEVLFGAPQRFRLTIFNPGTGPADRVAVSLIPPGKGSGDAATHVIGTLGPDEVKEIEMELTAREAGELILQASAVAAGGLKAEAIKRVQCHKPELEVDWRGPDQKYAGTETAYYFRVRNPGTAPTEPVEVRVRLPEGIRFVSASDSYSVDAQTGVVTWRLGGLAPGEEQYMQMHCQLDTPGNKNFDIAARTISGELRDVKSIRTDVIALADLKLNITDPQGACPVGETVVYEIRVENRGTTDAHGVSIVGLFSTGIDPVAVEGAQHAVRDGRVTFQPVRSLPAGGEILYRIRAVASQEGTHIFRAEVNCEDLDLKLAAEETTRFFQDEFHWEEGETPYTAERSPNSVRR